MGTNFKLDEAAQTATGWEANMVALGKAVVNTARDNGIPLMGLVMVTPGAQLVLEGCKTQAQKDALVSLLEQCTQYVRDTVLVDGVTR